MFLHERHYDYIPFRSPVYFPNAILIFKLCIIKTTVLIPMCQHSEVGCPQGFTG